MPRTPPESLWRVTESLKSMVNRCHQRTGSACWYQEECWKFPQMCFCVKVSAFFYLVLMAILCMNPGIHWIDDASYFGGVNERFLRLYSHKCIWPATYKTDHGHQESCAFSSGHGEKVQSSGWGHLAVSNLMGPIAWCLWGFQTRTKCRCWFCTTGRTRKHCNPLRMSSSLHHLIIMVLFSTGLEYKSRLRWSFFFFFRDGNSHWWCSLTDLTASIMHQSGSCQWLVVCCGGV